MDLQTLRTAAGRGFAFSPLTGVHALRLRRLTHPRVAPDRFVINGPTRLRLAPTARIELADGARLLGGFGGTMEVFQADRTRSALVMHDRATLRVEGRVQFGYGTKIRLSEGARLTLGDGVRIGANCLLVVVDDVTICAGTALSWDVTIMESHLHLIATEATPDPVKHAPVHIGAGALLGHGSLVLPGVSIGDGAVVGARSIVTRDVEPRTLVVGTPARTVGVGTRWT